MKSVIIFTTPSCKYCKMAKDFLKTKNTSYSEIDIVSNPGAQQEMLEKSGQLGVPVIEIDGKIIVGFDQEAINKALL
jgi:glutaredoxin-like YruB-family protein